MPPASPPQPDPDRARADRAGRLLDRLADMAMDRAEEAHKAALQAIRAGETAQARDLELMIDRASRGLRRTLALQAHLEHKRRQDARADAAADRARRDDKDDRRRAVAKGVMGAIQLDCPDGEQSENLSARVWQRLTEDPEIDAALTGQPIETTILQLCREMDVRPELLLVEDRYWPMMWRPLPDGSLPMPSSLGDRGCGEPDGMWLPDSGPERGRYWLLEQSDKIPVRGWYDLKTGKKLDGYPWDLPDSG